MSDKDSIIRMLQPVVIEMSYRSRSVYPRENFYTSIPIDARTDTTSYKLVDLLYENQQAAEEYLNNFGIRFERYRKNYIFTRTV